MKKIIVSLSLILAVIALCSGCATTGAALKDELQGTWVSDNGAVWTFTKNKYEFVDMENAVAGYGKFKFNKKQQIVFEGILDLGLDISTTVEDATDFTIKKFQKEAWKKYHELHPDRLEERYQELILEYGNKYRISGASSWYVYDYELKDNILITHEMSGKNELGGYPRWARMPYIDLTLHRQ
jgi:hypothetical protein